MCGFTEHIFFEDYELETDILQCYETYLNYFLNTWIMNQIFLRFKSQQTCIPKCYIHGNYCIYCSGKY